jgi:hypothetical protein
VKFLRKRIEGVGKGRRRKMTELFQMIEEDYRDNGRRSARTLGFRLVHLREVFGPRRDGRPHHPVRTGAPRGRHKATVNRELAALRRAFAPLP